MIEICNLEIENKEDIKNFLKNESLRNDSIFTSHKLQTGNAISTYQTYGRLFEQFDVFSKLSKLISEKVNLSFMDMWANINPPGTSVRPHNHYTPEHPNSLVGVYYLNKPINSGNLIIEGEAIDIQEDDVIFFNDKDIHWTQKNKSNEDRITISFNMRWHCPLIYNV